MSVRVGIEISVPRITICHHEACRLIANGDPQGQIFRFYPDTTYGFFFLLTIKYRIFMLKKLPEVPEYAEKRHDMMTSLKHNHDFYFGKT